MKDEPMFPQFEEEERKLRKQRRKEEMVFLLALFVTGAFITFLWML